MWKKENIHVETCDCLDENSTFLKITEAMLGYAILATIHANY